MPENNKSRKNALKGLVHKFLNYLKKDSIYKKLSLKKLLTKQLIITWFIYLFNFLFSILFTKGYFDFFKIYDDYLINADFVNIYMFTLGKLNDYILLLILIIFININILGFMNTLHKEEIKSNYISNLYVYSFTIGNAFLFIYLFSTNYYILMILLFVCMVVIIPNVIYSCKQEKSNVKTFFLITKILIFIILVFIMLILICSFSLGKYIAKQKCKDKGYINVELLNSKGKNIVGESQIIIGENKRYFIVYDRKNLTKCDNAINKEDIEYIAKSEVKKVKFKNIKNTDKK